MTADFGDGLWRRYMSDQQIAHPTVGQPPAMASLQPVALKWRSLIERRRAHFIELYLTGRWKRYYAEEEFLVVFRETMNMADRWIEIAPKPDDTKPDDTKPDDTKPDDTKPDDTKPGDVNKPGDAKQQAS